MTHLTHETFSYKYAINVKCCKKNVYLCEPHFTKMINSNNVIVLRFVCISKGTKMVEN